MRTEPQLAIPISQSFATHSPSRSPYLFVVGCPRSGTTLLRRMVDAHPLVAMTPELHWVPRYAPPDGLVTRRVLSKVVGHPRFAGLELSRDRVEALVAPGPVSYSSFVSAIFDLYGKARGRPLVGEKTPEYARRLDTLHALWPKAKFVHLIRDGRDTCLSILGWYKAHRAAGRFERSWNLDPVSTTALFWKWNVQLGREAGARLGPELYYELRYEAFVANPDRELEALCGFLALPYDDGMVRFHEGRERTPGLDARHAWLPVTPGLRDWRSQMDREDVERFEAAAGDLLIELGYPRAVPDPSPRDLAHAARMRDTFGEEAIARTKRPLPTRW